MLDCWMALNEQYTIELADMVAPYRVYWMEECLPPYDFEGFGRLRAAIKSTRIATGEHVYFRYGFRQLLEHNAAAIWQPDVHWCGGLTELRRIARTGVGLRYSRHSSRRRSPGLRALHHGHYQLPLGGDVHAAPGGPPEVYRRFEEENLITRGHEGVYMRPSERPGFGWEIEVAA